MNNTFIKSQKRASYRSCMSSSFHVYCDSNALTYWYIHRGDTITTKCYGPIYLSSARLWAGVYLNSLIY